MIYKIQFWTVVLGGILLGVRPVLAWMPDIPVYSLKSIVFDTPQVFDFLKVDSDAALLPS